VSALLIVVCAAFVLAAVGFAVIDLRGFILFLACFVMVAAGIPAILAFLPTGWALLTLIALWAVVHYLIEPYRPDDRCPAFGERGARAIRRRRTTRRHPATSRGGREADHARW
jgi:hypothetical protein